METRRLNITFHGIDRTDRELDSGEATVWVTLERFQTVLDAVRGRQDVHITFDDGNRSDIDHGLPALMERGLGATFFVVSGRLDRPGFLSAQHVRELAAAGMTIGSHGLDHRPWREASDAELQAELVDSRRALEDVIGGPVTAAACPFGSYDRRVLRALRQAGYERVYTSDRGTASRDAWLQARTTITEDAPLEPILSDEGAPSLRRRAELVAKRWR